MPRRSKIGIELQNPQRMAEDAVLVGERRAKLHEPPFYSTNLLGWGLQPTATATAHISMKIIKVHKLN
jgi:hypothetical protein